MQALLSRSGWPVTDSHQPSLKSAPRLRTGGYIIDFWGAGFDIAEQMGILPEVLQQRLQGSRTEGGWPEGEIAWPGSRSTHSSAMTRGRYISVPRSELAASIFDRLEGKVETIFGESVDGIEQTDRCVRVTLRSGGVREFDLLVGADGLHSRVRELAFGPERDFEKFLGYKVAAAAVEGYRPRDELVYVLYTEVGQQVGRFTMRDNRTLFLFTFADSDLESPDRVEGQKALLRRRFGSSGWECPQILDALDGSRDFYFDRVSQIHMPPGPGLWTRGRVTLVGDAAFCVSLLAGQGSALAMVAAYVLAGELHRSNGDYAGAFRRYQDLFGPFVAGKQKAALRFAGSFAPKSKLSLFLRNRIFNLMSIGWVANLALGSGLADKIVLPDY